MPYYEKDVNTVAALESELAAIVLPLVRVRKLNAILNAIEVQVEDEYADRQVVDALFEALLLAASSVDSPALETFRRRVEVCRAHIAKRLSLRAAGGR